VASDERTHRLLIRYLFVSLAAAVATIALKSLAAAITGSVGLLSDALEGGVNLVAAVVALFALRAADLPPDANHNFGHGKAEYLSAAVEGGMIFVAATAIVWTSVERLVHPVPLDQTGVGLVLATVAAAINLAVGLTLVRVGRRHRSITLVADGRHLLTDVWTTAGVLVGVTAVAITGWERLDPIIALVVGANILRIGYRLLRRSVVGLLDAALPADDAAAVNRVIERYRREHPVDFHALRTRESGRQRFVYVHLLVPDEWTVKAGHDLAEALEADIERELAGTVTFVHLEPRGDPTSYGHGGVDAVADPAEIEPPGPGAAGDHQIAPEAGHGRHSPR
jgi:cation diffusion facilitator family transporter